MTPPKNALKFLRWFCREDCIEEIEGDLTEIFEEQYEKSPNKAKRKFAWNVIKSFRPEFIKSFKTNYSTNSVDMFRHNFLMIYRNFRRYKSSFLINLIGLSTGLACGLLIYLWVSDELNMDKFHERDNQLYQILTTHPNEEGIDTWTEGPVPLAPALAEEMPEVEYAVSASRLIDNCILSVGELHFNSPGKFADKNYFNIFSYEFKQGDPSKVLLDKSSIVISESMAMKLFNTTDNILGKTITWQFSGIEKGFAVSGVFKDIPSNSSERFDFAASFEVFKDIVGTEANWGNHQARIFLALKEGTDIADFSSRIVNFTKTKNKGDNVTLLLQKYSDQYLYGKFENGVQAGGRIDYVRLFSIIAVFIVLIACINFMNLSTAKASRRIKEVGIKKALGAHRTTLIFQHLEESMLMSALSFFTALLFVQLFLPQFNMITGKHLSLGFDVNLVTAFLVIIFFTGLIAGSYPALYLSGFNPVVVLKGKLETSFGELFIRKGLVVFQFALSIILIVSVMVVYKQIELIQNQNLGFNRENIVHFKTEGRVRENLETFLAEVKNIPGVVRASSMWGSIIGQTGVTQGFFNWEGKDPNAVVAFSHLGVNYDMLELLGVKMKEGRTFSRDFSNDTTKIIINEAGIQVMGLKDPVGKKFNLWGNEMEIIGVAKNFNFRSLHESVKPFFFRLKPKEPEKVMIKIVAGKERETIGKIQKFYTSFNPGFAFDYQFLDEEYQAQYVAELRVSVLSHYFAGFAILISCLGLFGLASFTAERRLKEIGIRKILGSSEFGIVALLSGDFTKSVLISISIALPVSYLIARSWLEGFAFSIDLEWWYFFNAGILTMLIAWLTIGLQTLKAARVNPTASLKSE